MVGFSSIIRSIIYVLMNLVVIILLIRTSDKTKKKELEPKCKKKFTKSFNGYLFFLIFVTFFNLVYWLFRVIFGESYGIDPHFSITLRFVWGITYGLAFLNQFIAFIVLFRAMGNNLFIKKSKSKFTILSIILLSGVFFLIIVEIIMYYVFPYEIYSVPGEYGKIIIPSLPYAITRLVVVILAHFNYLIIGIVALILLKKTEKEDNMLREYTKPLSEGVILLFIILPLFNQLEGILTFINYMTILNGSLNFNIISYWLNNSIFYLSSLSFIIGIIILTTGAIKTMSVPLTFSRKKTAKRIQPKVVKRIPPKVVKRIPPKVVKKIQPRSVKRIPSQQKVVNTCPKCGATIPYGARFCIKCGQFFH